MRLPFCLFCLFSRGARCFQGLERQVLRARTGVTDVSYGDLVKCQIDIVGDSTCFGSRARPEK